MNANDRSWPKVSVNRSVNGPNRNVGFAPESGRRFTVKDRSLAHRNAALSAARVLPDTNVLQRALTCFQPHGMPVNLLFLKG